MKKDRPSAKEVAVVAVPDVDQARRVLLESGLFDACPGSADSVIDKENGIQIRLIPIASKS
jgi:hypothetical protein